MTDTDPQHAAPSLREQIVAAINSYPVACWTPGNLADRALGVILPHGKFLGDQLRDAEQQLAEARGQVDRVRRVIAERRTEVAERETDGMLPLGTPGASWCDAVTVTCDRIDDALKIHPEPVGIPCPPDHDTGPSVREAADNDRAHWNTKYAGEGT